MFAYIIRRLLLIIPTLFAIMVVNFLVIQIAPGGPVEQAIAELTGTAVEATARVSGASGGEVGTSGQAQLGADSSSATSKYRGARGLDPDLILSLQKQYGFVGPDCYPERRGGDEVGAAGGDTEREDDPCKPLSLGKRFLKMLGNYVRFDFGDSFFRDESVVGIVAEKLPVSISLGLWTTLLAYLISIPLGIAKAVRDGSRFDVWTSGAIIVGYAIPSFLFAVLLIVLFAGGSYVDWFPLRGLTSSNFDELSLGAQIADYFWHLVLPIMAMAIGGFATLTMLTKNSFLEEVNKQYVITARAKGLTERRVLYGHIFRNAMLIIIAGFPGQFIGILFTGALLIEVIFSLDGLGLLGFESLIKRDYPIIFGTLFVFTLLGLVVNLIGDLMYVLIDPRIDFEKREA